MPGLRCPETGIFVPVETPGIVIVGGLLEINGVRFGKLNRNLDPQTKYLVEDWLNKARKNMKEPKT